MRAARLLLLLVGAAMAGYGGWLLYPQLVTVWPWLVAGPLLHDALVAPLVGLAGLAAVRLVRDPVRRAWLSAGLVTTGTLLLIAVPLIWRPAPAPANPGLQDRNYPLELAVGLAVVWTLIMIAGWACRPGRTGRPPSSAPRWRPRRSARPPGHDPPGPARSRAAGR